MYQDVNRVWILIILHSRGSEIYVFREESTAREQLFLYVKEYWSHEYPREDMPEERDDAIAEYFNRIEHESYILVKQKVLKHPEE